MRRVRIEAEADRELNEAAAWYETRSPGTGARLLDAFENALTVLREDPVPSSRCRVKRAPLARNNCCFIDSPSTLSLSRKTMTLS